MQSRDVSIGSALLTFILELWAHYRSRGVKLGGHFLEAASVYVGLYLFELLEHCLPISGWSASVIDNLHAAGSVAVLLVFTIRCLIEILPARLREILCSLAWTQARRNK